MGKPPNRRRRVLIDEMQYRMLVVNIVYFFVILLIFLTALFAPLVVQLLDSDTSVFARERIAQQFLLFDETIWLPVLLTFFCLAAHSILVSHRIAGPLHQFRRLLGAVGDGDLSVRAVLREKDYLQKEELAMNGMIEKLSCRIGDAGEEAEELRTRLGWLRTAITTRSTGEVLDQLRTLDENADSLRATLGQFTLPRESAAATGPVLISRTQ